MRRRFHISAGVLWAYTLAVIIWGAWVRISKSGDGCGDHWPLCKGQVLPSEVALATWIEFTHRMMSGIFGIFVFALWIYSLRTFPKNHPARKLMTIVLAFTFTEALLGAKLVLSGLTGSNASLFRAGVMSLHMVNSLLLTGSAILTWELSKPRTHLSWSWDLNAKRFAWITASFFLLITTSGAVASLSSTLYPSQSLISGFFADWSSASPLLLRLRLIHPVAAVILGLMLSYQLTTMANSSSGSPLQRFANGTFYFLFGGIGFGLLTLALLAPTWMKLVHLAIAHILWSRFVLLNEKLACADEAQEVSQGLPEPI